MDNENLYSSRSYRQTNAVFLNAGGGRFEDAHLGGTPRAHRGSAFGDFDNDGRMDVVTSSLNEPAELWHNLSPRGQHWLELLLEGTKSNRDAIGAKVKVVLSSGRVQYNHVTTAVGYAVFQHAACTSGWGGNPWPPVSRSAGPAGTSRRSATCARTGCCMSGNGPYRKGGQC